MKRWMLLTVLSGLFMTFPAPATTTPVTTTPATAAPSPAAEPRVAVLIYHDVSLTPYSPYVVTPERLAADLQWLLDQGWRPLSLAGFAAWMAGDATLSGDWFLLTFDDGYLGWAEHGYPVLRALGVPAVQFVVTGGLGRTGWAQGPPTLSPARVAVMAREGLVTFGDHTCGLHQEVAGSPMVKQVSGAVVAKDLDISRAILKRLTGADPTALAWPYGASTPAAAAVAAERYELIFLAEDGFARQGEPHAIPRFGLDWRSPEELPVLFAPRAAAP